MSVRNYDKLFILLQKDQAIGSLVVGAKKERQLHWVQEQNLDVDDTFLIGSPQDGIRVETFVFVKETTTKTSFSFANVSISTTKSSK